MSPITQQEIEAMRQNGAEPAIIHEAEVRLDRFNRGLELAERISDAFKGVTLGDGVGLRQADGLDDCEDGETLARLRADDEKESWERIPPSSLHFCTSYFDAEGMRFHLPAYLTAYLRGQFWYDMIFDLTRLGPEQFSLLDKEQRLVVRDFLLLVREDPHECSDHAAIDEVLETYWLEDGRLPQG